MVFDSDIAINLSIENNPGSVEHYYHFLLGFLFPLAIKHSSLRSLGFQGPVFVRSCGPMDRILKECGFSGVDILERVEHLRNLSRSSFASWQLRQETAYGMDFFNGDYPVAQILQAAKVIRSQLKDRLCLRSLSETGNVTKSKVLLISRSVDPFFNSDNAEIRTSGSQRRSIENFTEVRMALEAACGDVANVVLENMTLSEQITLFSSSDIVVAQHGAALANIVWCRPGTRVIEIAPPGYRVTCFPPLSKCLDLDHRLVRQSGEHGPCDVSDLISNIS